MKGYHHTFSFISQEVINFTRCTIICDDIVPLIVHVQNEVLTL